MATQPPACTVSLTALPDPCAVSLTEHPDRVHGQVWWGAECDQHGPLMDGDWHDRATVDRAIAAHLDLLPAVLAAAATYITEGKPAVAALYTAAEESNDYGPADLSAQEFDTGAREYLDRILDKLTPAHLVLLSFDPETVLGLIANQDPDEQGMGAPVWSDESRAMIAAARAHCDARDEL